MEESSIIDRKRSSNIFDLPPTHPYAPEYYRSSSRTKVPLQTSYVKPSSPRITYPNELIKTPYSSSSQKPVSPSFSQRPMSPTFGSSSPKKQFKKYLYNFNDGSFIILFEGKDFEGKIMMSANGTLTTEFFEGRKFFHPHIYTNRFEAPITEQQANDLKRLIQRESIRDLSSLIEFMKF